MYLCEKCHEPMIRVEDMSSPLIADFTEVCHKCKTQLHIINNYGYDWSLKVIDEDYDEEYSNQGITN